MQPHAFCGERNCDCSSRQGLLVTGWLAAGIFGFRPTLHCYNYTNALVPATFTRDTVGKPALWSPGRMPLIHWLTALSCCLLLASIQGSCADKMQSCSLTVP